MKILQKLAAKQKDVFSDNAATIVVFGDSNIASLKKVCLCSLAVAVITFVSAFFYPPFYVISLACAGCALSIKVTKDLFAAELEKRREELYETVREEL